ncbi:MAG: tyrosine-type recombinase/integrase, partial [Gemmatimonadaceae bacterium]
FLEIDEAANLLKATEKVTTRYVPLTELAATLLLTGGRLNEVLGLEINDIDFARKTVSIRQNKWRELKRGVERTIPLWPQLETVLKPYIADRSAVGSRLLFPGFDAAGQEQKLHGKLYKHFTRTAIEAGVVKRVTPQTLRVTYCAARLQSLDNGHPVAMFTVQKEMGHGSLDMIQRVYGRLGQFRPRTEGVSYDVMKKGDALMQQVK